MAFYLLFLWSSLIKRKPPTTHTFQFRCCGGQPNAISPAPLALIVSNKKRCPFLLLYFVFSFTNKSNHNRITKKTIICIFSGIIFNSIQLHFAFNINHDDRIWSWESSAQIEYSITFAYRERLQANEQRREGRKNIGRNNGKSIVQAAISMTELQFERTKYSFSAIIKTTNTNRAYTMLLLLLKC